jgi:hypothetical protein
MKTREKAKELYWKYYQNISDTSYPEETAKQCALIAVDENIKVLENVLDESTNICQSLKTPKKLCIDILNPILEYLKEVKEQIQKL